jgi:hypothetical protein
MARKGATVPTMTKRSSAAVSKFSRSEVRRITTRTTASRDDWRTPTWIQELFTHFCREEGYPTWDPYPSPIAGFHFCTYQKPIEQAEEQLGQPVQDPRIAVWANPPYGRALKHHAIFISRLMQTRALVVALVPARPGCRWWNELAQPGRLVVVPHERLHFDDGPDPAMFPSAMIIGGRDDAARFAFADVWRGEAWIASPIASQNYFRDHEVKP